MAAEFKLKNYSSTIPPEKSIMKIEELLVMAGASHISKFYENGEIKGLFFQIEIERGVFRVFKLPSKTDEIKKLYRNTEHHQEQAVRTAWKILYEWIYIQITMIKMNQRNR